MKNRDILLSNKILDFPLRKFLIISFGFFFVIWGASWSVPIIDLSYSYIWIAAAIFCLLFFNDYKININEILIIPVFIIVVSFYFILGMPDSLSSDKPIQDIIYLTTYYTKLIFGFLTFWAILNIFKNPEDITLFLISCSVFIIYIVSFLAWKYLIVYDLDYIGVVVDDSLGGNKTFKNSLATSLALLSPFLFAAVNKEKKLRTLYLVSFLSVLFFMYWVNSRSALIILALSFLIFLFLSKSKSIKRVVRIGIVISIVLLTVTGFSVNQWVNKSGTYSDSGYKLIVQEGLLETHRGRMLIASLDGAYESAGLGNGLATFRIRPSNEGSRTETHNDYALLLYEQGIIGFSLITYLILWRIFITIYQVVNLLVVQTKAKFLISIDIALITIF